MSTQSSKNSLLEQLKAMEAPKRVEASSIPKGSIVYIRYKDHVLFRNITQPLEDAAERETVGWLTQETGELLCIQNDRTVEEPHYPSGSASGLLILKSCILKIQTLPLQTVPNESLSSADDKATTAEYAPQTTKRKTQPK